MKQNGITFASISLSLGLGHFKYDPEITGPRDIIDAISVSSFFYFFIFWLWLLMK